MATSNNVSAKLQTDGSKTPKKISNERTEKIFEEVLSKKNTGDAHLYYKMVTSSPKNKTIRGRCVIFNYSNFNDSKESQSKVREGSEVDVTNLCQTFSKLNYKIIVHQDLTHTKTKSELNLESKVDHGPYDSFVLFFLSHGKKGDGKLMFHFNDQFYTN